ncbi:MAG: hypothetical protein BIFFINMI_04136 [Phycisphaerae bacterium]|nr:hypothetical protein [Phycisphaerae bacterium]
MTELAVEIPIHLQPLDIVAIAAPLAILLLIMECAYYWRSGRRPGDVRSRLLIAAGALIVLIPAALLLILRWHPWALLIIGAVLVVWALHSYQETTSPVSREVRIACAVLRIVAILLLLAYLLRPTIQHVRTHYEKAVLILLYDVSDSMHIPDAGGDAKTQRIEAVRQALNSNAGAMKKLHDSFDVQQYSFGRTLGQPLGNPAADLSLSPDEKIGGTTAIGRAIQKARENASDRNVAGIILVTDGRNTLQGPGIDPQKLANSLADDPTNPIYVYPVGVGRDKPDTDRPMIMAKSLKLPGRKVPAFNIMQVHAVFQMENLPDHPVKFELLLGTGKDAKVVDSREVTLPAGQTGGDVSFDVQATPIQTGFQAVTVRVAPGQTYKNAKLDADKQTSITDYVQVVDNQILVLYVEGKFRYEAKYLTQALAGSDLITLNRQYLLTSAALAGGANQQLPRTEADWQKFHVIILGDVKADVFTAEQLRWIAIMVRDMGKGLAMIGGRDTYAAGGWSNTPIASLLPFDVSKAAGQLDAPFHLTPTDLGLRHQIMKLGKDDAQSRKLWGLLPTIQGANRFPATAEIQADHPAATVLATTETGQPVMVAQPVGKGRTLTSAMDTTWRWRFQIPDGEGPEVHSQFWRQVIRWLANREGSVWVQTDQPRYSLSNVRLADTSADDRQQILVTAGIEDQMGNPVRDPEATLTEWVPADSGSPNAEPQPLKPMKLAGFYSAANKRYEIKLPPPSREGSYRLLFEATMPDGKKSSAEANFIVASINLELENPLADFELLRQMAQPGADKGRKTFAGIDPKTGPAIYTANSLGKLLDQFKSSDYLVKREQLETTELGDRNRWPILVLFIAVIATEWVIRKRRNLV